MFTKNTYSVTINKYAHSVLIPTLPTDNAGIEPRKVRILTLSNKVGILTSRRTIQELSRFSLCAEHIYSECHKLSSDVQLQQLVLDSFIL